MIRDICENARAGSREMALVNTDVKNRALKAMAEALLKNKTKIAKANEKDLKSARSKKLPEALIDRLTLSDARIMAMANSLKNIAGMKDPVGRVIETVKRPNGLSIKKVSVPIGVILIIYESRPNVTSDCVGLCLKSGNAVILRGGKEAINSNTAIFDVLKNAAMRCGIPEGAISIVKDTDRSLVNDLLKESGHIDLVMPRGGESLIREITNNSRIPVIKHYKGVCHTYVDDGADLDMAEDICFNAKVQRPGVCNAMETMLVSEKTAKAFLPGMIERFRRAGVEIRGCPMTRKIAGMSVKRAAELDWYTEYLDLILSVRVVKGIDEAIDHIMKYGSYHSDAIVTNNKKAADKFLSRVDSACVYVNASTRFTDGGEFGKGAEIGVSTDKIHARGPVGLSELTSYKYIIKGNGQVRI
jgi:glutamate-5-semialdehyde dehydrogenase